MRNRTARRTAKGRRSSRRPGPRRSPPPLPCHAGGAAPARSRRRRRHRADPRARSEAGRGVGREKRAATLPNTGRAQARLGKTIFNCADNGQPSPDGHDPARGPDQREVGLRREAEAEGRDRPEERGRVLVRGAHQGRARDPALHEDVRRPALLARQGSAEARDPRPDEPDPLRRPRPGEGSARRRHERPLPRLLVQ
jgi:hypothetical protein